MTKERSPGPEEYWGCRRECFEKGEHTAVWGECEKAPPPPCEHPAEAISWDQTQFCVACRDCTQEVTLRTLAEQAHVALTMGCTCHGDVCSDNCGARPLSWTLDPAKILAYAAAEQQSSQENRCMMVTFHPEEWTALLEVSRKSRSTPEQFVGIAARGAIRIAREFRD